MCKKNLSNIGLFAHEEPKNPSNPCRFLASALKDAFAHCHIFPVNQSSSSPEEECLVNDIDDEQEVVVLEIQSRAMEAKLRRKGLMTESHCWVLSSKAGELFITPKGVQQIEDNKDEEDIGEVETFLSAGSCFSRCSSASREVFLSVGSCLSRCSSMSGVDFGDARRRSILQEFCHCEGWPFGLCRKAVLLPPLPRSPSESWSWRRGNRIVKMT